MKQHFGRERKFVLTLVRMSLRRTLNKLLSRLGSVRKLKKTKAPEKAPSPRTATPRKQKSNQLLTACLGLLMLFWMFQLSTRALWSLHAATSRDDMPIHHISQWLHQGLENLEAFPVDVTKSIYDQIKNDGNYSLDLSPETLRKANSSLSPKEQQTVRKQFDQLAEQELNAYFPYLSDKERASRKDAWYQLFQREGADAFTIRLSLRQYPPLIPGEELWQSRSDQTMAKSVSLILSGLFFLVLFTQLTARHKDLSKPEWSMAWLYSFPVSARCLLYGRLFEYAFSNIYAFCLFVPFLTALFLAGGLGMLSVPLALFWTIMLNTLIAACYLLLETWLRMRCTRKQIQRTQGAFTVLALPVLLFLLFIAQTATPPVWLTRFSQQLPGAVTWLPTSLAANVPEFDTMSMAFFLAVAVFFSVSCISIACVHAASMLMQCGLIQDGQLTPTPRGARKTVGTTGAASYSTFPTNAPPLNMRRKELLLLFRDRNMLLRTLVMPPVILLINLLIQRDGLSIFKDFQHTASFAYGVGMFTLLGNAFMILTFERQSLWMLYSFPGSIDKLLLQKVRPWLFISMIYPTVFLGIGFVAAETYNETALINALLVYAGCAIYTFIAAGLGILGTDIYEQEPHKMIGVSYTYLFMLLATMFLATIYQPLIWPKLVQVVLSSLLAVAIWQKVKYHTPYLLDPVAKPPAQIDISESFYALLAFFVIQNVLMLTLTKSTAQTVFFSQTVLISYAVSGGLVLSSSLLMFWRNRVPNLLQQVGLKRPADINVIRTTILALAGGTVAGTIGIMYVTILEKLPLLAPLLKAHEDKTTMVSETLPPSIAILAVFLAPFFEEYLFRGLVLKSMQRSMTAALAVTCSALLFAIVHPPISFIPVFGLGLLTGFVFLKTRWLFACFVIHAVYNAMILVAHEFLTAL
jgi:membrane protease YdiL (CAAX protease family)